MSDQPKIDNPIASLGGRATAAKMTPRERRERARLAAEARWNAGIMKAVCGSPDKPLVIGNKTIQAYVLEDGTRVLTQGDFQEALGRHRKAHVRYQAAEEPVPPILQGKLLKPFISNELLEKSQPIRFRTPQNAVANGYRAEILPEVCEVFLRARDAGALQKQLDHIAVQAEILIRSLAKVGIIALVDEATGYQELRAKNALTEILEAFIAEEIRKWAPTFPAKFYREMFRLKNLPFNGTAKRPRFIGKLTNDLIYRRLAPGVLEELQRKNPVVNEKGQRKNKHHQWLTGDIGHPALREHLEAVSTLMMAADTWDQFYKMLNRTKPVYRGPTLFDDIKED
jgi:hypothetical protein